MKTTNHEYYVSLEVAKLLKEAGFDWEGTAYYQHGVFYPYSVYRERLVVMNQSSAPSYMEQYSAPTLDVAQKWLREIKGIFICTTPEIKDYQATWNFYICDEQGLFYENEDCFLTYEEAQEIGIKKALELILEKGE